MTLWLTDGLIWLLLIYAKGVQDNVDAYRTSLLNIPTNRAALSSRQSSGDAR